MLKDDLYTIQKIADSVNSIEAIVALNAQHEIFKGHFPSQPLLPGVCMMQMTKEIIQTFLNTNLQLLKADDIRFSAMINPDEGKELKFIIQYNFMETCSINVAAKIMKEEVVCFKMKAAYKIQ